MRLLNVQSLQLVDFGGSKIPPYAILSHTWGSEEATFDEAKMGMKLDVRKAGYRKISYSAKQTMKHGVEYLWVDTCCQFDLLSTSAILF
jgi:hypothetical protein